MTRVERLELTRKLLDEHRVPERAIAKLVGRSQRWVRTIARRYPRHSGVTFVTVPRVARTSAAAADKPARRAQGVHRSRRSLRSRWREFSKTCWRWADVTGTIVLVVGLLWGLKRGIIASNGKRFYVVEPPHYVVEQPSPPPPGYGL